MKAIKINEMQFIDIIQTHNQIYYAGCYGDPCEYGYETVYEYYILRHGKLYQLDSNHNINYILERFIGKNNDIILKIVPQEWYKDGKIW